MNKPEIAGPKMLSTRLLAAQPLLYKKTVIYASAVFDYPKSVLELRPSICGSVLAKPKPELFRLGHACEHS
jgi:hypothetical protein